MAKKPAKKTATKKADHKGASVANFDTIKSELDSLNGEWDKFNEKGTKACLGRVRKHLMNIKRAASEGRKNVQEVRNSLK